MKQRLIQKHRGFTLVEVAIVVVIIGILVSVAMPRYQKAVERSRISEAQSILGSLRSAQFSYASARSRFTGSMSDLDMNVSQYGKFFNFSAYQATSPFDGSDDSVAGATRNTVAGGRYGSCSQYTIVITESGNFTSTDCAELYPILN